MDKPVILLNTGIDIFALVIFIYTIIIALREEIKYRFERDRNDDVLTLKVVLIIKMVIMSLLLVINSVAQFSRITEDFLPYQSSLLLVMSVLSQALFLFLGVFCYIIHKSKYKYLSADFWKNRKKK